MGATQEDQDSKTESSALVEKDKDYGERWYLLEVYNDGDILIKSFSNIGAGFGAAVAYWEHTGLQVNRSSVWFNIRGLIHMKIASH